MKCTGRRREVDVARRDARVQLPVARLDLVAEAALGLDLVAVDDAERRVLVEVELDDRALGHGVDLDGFRVFGGFFVLLLEHDGSRRGGRGGRQKGAGGVEGGGEGDVAAHFC